MLKYAKATLIPGFTASFLIPPVVNGTSRNQVFAWDDIHHTMDVSEALAKQFPQERFLTVSQGDENTIWVDFQPGKCQDLMAILKFARQVPFRGD